MKTLILGDIHGRTVWKDIVDLEQPDRVIFLGDYVSTHEDISDQQQIDNLEEILQYKEANPDSVIILRGNHDLEALGYYWAHCYPWTSKQIHDYMSENKERFLKNTQWILAEDGVIYSHAGIVEPWFNKLSVKSVEDINTLEPSELFGFSGDDRFDSYGTGKTQPCTWVRPSTLVRFGIEGVHVVGHTTVQDDLPKYIDVTKFGTDLEEDYVCGKATGIWLCDCLGTTGYFENPNEKGKSGYLLNVDGKFTTKAYGE